MTQAYFTSPFCPASENDEPWTLWEKQSSVTALGLPEETDRRFDNDDDCSIAAAVQGNKPLTQHTNRPVIQRMQYNAVLDRMNQAVRKTGSFSAWQN